MGSGAGMRTGSGAGGRFAGGGGATAGSGACAGGGAMGSTIIGGCGTGSGAGLGGGGIGDCCGARTGWVCGWRGGVMQAASAPQQITTKTETTLELCNYSTLGDPALINATATLPL